MLIAYNSMDCYVKNGKIRILSETQMVEPCEVLEENKTTLKAVCVTSTLKDL